jgi:hypothetical protein
MHQGVIKDRCITIYKRVGKLLQLMTVVMRQHVALNKIVQFTLKVNNTAGFVSGEEAAKMHPDAVSMISSQL